MVQTNISYEIRKIVTKCFPKTNKISKILNKNTIKTSWCTTASLGAKIKQHNEKIIKNTKKKDEQKKKMCSCPSTEVCPVEGKCLTRSVIYNAEVITTNRKKLTKVEKRKLDALENLEKK